MMVARNLWRDEQAASAAEFAIVLPLFLLLLFGTIDAGRFIWEYNKAEKATQVGARLATVTDPLASGLIEADYAGEVVDGTTIGAGDRIPAGALGSILCNDTGCEEETPPTPSDLGTFDSATFNDIIVARMKLIYPAIEAENVEVRYKGSGFGYAGSATGPGGGGGGGG
ncbi:MAG TPA: TadE/TadG family type IV pilus assembly protein, partial [Sphingomicrobium sp.]